MSLISSDPAPHLIFFALHVVGFSFASTAFPSLVSRYAEAGEQGTALGAAQTARALSRVLSPLCAGELYSYSLDQSSGLFSGGSLPFLVGAILAFMATVASIGLLKCHDPDEATTAEPQNDETAPKATMHVGTGEGIEDEPDVWLVFLMHHVAQNAGCPHFRVRRRSKREDSDSGVGIVSADLKTAREEAIDFWVALMGQGGSDVANLAKEKGCPHWQVLGDPEDIVNQAKEAGCPVFAAPDQEPSKAQKRREAQGGRPALECPIKDHLHLLKKKAVDIDSDPLAAPRVEQRALPNTGGGKCPFTGQTSSAIPKAVAGVSREPAGGR